MSGAGESGAVMEALADIFGEFFEDYADGSMDGSCNWSHGSSRNFIKPEKSEEANLPHPTVYQGEHWVDISEGSDKFSHVNSTVISHATYLMWNGIDNTEAKKIPTEKLAKIWYRAMLMMPSDCDFGECRTLVELAAESLDLTDRQARCVSEAFDAVGIAYGTHVDYTISPNAELCVYDCNSAPYGNYSYQVRGTMSKRASELGQQYADTQTVSSSEPHKLALKEGHYTIRLLDNTDAQQPYIFTVHVTTNGGMDRLDIYTDYYTEKEVTEMEYEMRTKRIECPLSDGRIYYYNEINYPYFKGTSNAEETLNAHYADILEDCKKNDTDYDALYASQKEMGWDNGSGIPYYDTLSAEVAYNKNGVISIKETSVIWSGGMHPYHAISGLTYEVESGNKLDYLDILQGSEEQIDQIFREKLEESVGGARDYLVKSLKENTGYALTEDGLCFYLNMGDALERALILIPCTSEDTYQIDVAMLLDSATPEESDSYVGYAAAIEEAIELCKEVSAYAKGGGFLYDLNGDGQEELIIVHDMLYKDENYIDGFPTKVCSVFTMKNGEVITLLSHQRLYIEAGGPSGSAGVVMRNGRTYLFTTWETGETGAGARRYGEWNLYEMGTTALLQSTRVEYLRVETWTDGGSATDDLQSSATIDGRDTSYESFENWVDEITRVKETAGCISYYSGKEDGIPLEELLKRV